MNKILCELLRLYIDTYLGHRSLTSIKSPKGFIRPKMRGPLSPNGYKRDRLRIQFIDADPKSNSSSFRGPQNLMSPGAFGQRAAD